MKFIFASLCLLTSLWSAPNNWENFKRDTFLQLPKIAGWCSQEKAEKLMDFIYEVKPNICVEIGAFGGSTTYPLARTLQFLQYGKLWAIDAWDVKTAIEGLELDNPNIAWWSQLNMRVIYHQFMTILQNGRLLGYCEPISMLSEEASQLFLDASIDLLYIDGNFSRDGTMKDVLSYFPKVKEGGYIWLNDADVLEKNMAVTFLMRNCTWLREKSLGKNCVVFKKRING